MKRAKPVAVGLLGEHRTPSGELVIERWLPHGWYRRSSRDFVEVFFDSLMWINPETKKYWAITKDTSYVWGVSSGEAQFWPRDLEEDRGPWFTDTADDYEELADVDAGEVPAKLPLRLGMIAHEMLPRFLKLQREYPVSPRRRRVR